MNATNIPEGFAQVAPYFFAERALDYMSFLVEGLGGVEVGRHLAPDGTLANGQVRFGSATVMVSQASAAFPPSRAANYLYVADADAAMARAIEHGAESVTPVADMDYGDRQGGVKDPGGNLWWISQRLVEEPYY